jgi:lipopolysaccharide transport system ATP-binding protein
MSDTIIKVEGLGKRYFIGHENQGSYTAMRDVIANNVKEFGKGIQRILRNDISSSISGGEIEEFWALKDIDFDIKKGEAVGIIGRNGAGKSTLLKVLSRITESTKGRVEIKGRLASLLEVGTGFHPELTGRENIFLNGAILGMGRAETKSKFDEIVDFSGVEKFLDTPVKRYSSGMYVRLAFAVAAHLESEILIVDEVLAVGDAEFQKKCLGKMGDVAKGEGRTVLFVSHNMMAIKQLCKRGIYLKNGTVEMLGDIDKVVDCYSKKEVKEYSFKPIVIKDIDIVVNSIQLNAENGGVINPFQQLTIDIEIESKREIDKIGLELLITHVDTSGIVFATNTKTRKNIDIKLKNGINKITCLIKSFDLCSGNYTLGFGIDLPFVLFYYYEKELMDFVVEEIIEPPSLLPTSSAYGRVYLDHEWIN